PILTPALHGLDLGRLRSHAQRVVGVGSVDSNVIGWQRVTAEGSARGIGWICEHVGGRAYATGAPAQLERGDQRRRASRRGDQGLGERCKCLVRKKLGPITLLGEISHTVGL